jgi:hypothetical protein
MEKKKFSLSQPSSVVPTPNGGQKKALSTGELAAEVHRYEVA